MELPEGTVTFLLTDVEGGTRLWDLFPDAMTGAINRYEEILRGSINDLNGIVIKTTGDGLHAVFSAAIDAVKAALACQRELAQETWNPKTGRLRVRIALQSGTAQLRGGDYYGDTLNRAAKLLSAGHGDQILISQSTGELIRAALPTDAALIDLGCHRLKNLLRPEHIYQLTVPDIPSNFPVLRRLDPRSVSIPSQLTPFIGRTEEIGALRNLLKNDEVRVVTLVGAGGAGKTRLAVQTAAEIVADFPDGSFFIDLTPIVNPQLIPTSIANVLGIRETVVQSIEENVTQYLRSRSILLILDNFEQILDGAALVSQIVEEAPGIKIIVTSRKPLALEGERQYRVKGLPYPQKLDSLNISDYDAINLFINIAQRANPDFSLEDELDGVIKICQLVQGLPLAIELAAPWVKVMPTEEIVYEIHRNISILTTRLKNIPERQKSLIAIFEQSWSYLSTQQRNTFAALSVFQGSFQLAAAKEIAGASYKTILELVDKSLLRWSSVKRFSIHELLRQHVENQLRLSPGEYLLVRNLHCEYYADFAGEFQGELFCDQHLEAMTQFGEDLENIRSAWEWAAAQLRLEQIQKISQALYDLEYIKGRYIESDILIIDVIIPLEATAESSQKDAVLSQLYLIQSWHCIRRGKFKVAAEYAEKSLELLEKHDLSPRPGFAGDPSAALGVVANALGNYEQAEEYGNIARDRAKSLGESLKLQLALNVLSNAAYYQGSYQDARDLALKAKSAALDLGGRWFLATILNDLGRIDQVMGEYKSASNNFRTTYKLRKDFDDLAGMATALKNLAAVSLLEKEYTQGKQFFEQSRWLYLDIGDRGGLARSLKGLARTARLTGNLESACRDMAEALDIAAELGFAPLALELLAEAGELLITGRLPEQGILLLAGVSVQPGANHETQQQTQKLLDSNQEQFPYGTFESIVEGGQDSTLDQLLSAANGNLSEFEVAQELKS